YNGIFEACSFECFIPFLTSLLDDGTVFQRRGILYPEYYWFHWLTHLRIRVLLFQVPAAYKIAVGRRRYRGQVIYLCAEITYARIIPPWAVIVLRYFQERLLHPHRHVTRVGAGVAPTVRRRWIDLG